MIRKITCAIVRSSGHEQKEKGLSVTIILKCDTKMPLDRPYKLCGQESGVKDVVPCRNQTPVTRFTLRSAIVYAV